MPSTQSLSNRSLASEFAAVILRSNVAERQHYPVSTGIPGAIGAVLSERPVRYRLRAWHAVLVLTEISPNPAISPESARFLRVGFVSRSPRLELRRLIGPFVSGLKIPFPGNGDLGSKRLGSNGCFSDPEDEHFRSVLEGGNLPVILGRCGRVGIAPPLGRVA